MEGHYINITQPGKRQNITLSFKYKEQREELLKVLNKTQEEVNIALWSYSEEKEG